MDAESWGDYTVLKKLGEGGMAVVYLAHPHDVPDHRVVLKELKEARHGERFKGEARNLARLKDHPNICHLYHFFPRDGRTVLVTEYIEGATLDEITRLDSQLDIGTVCKVGIDVLDVLEFAHERRIYHRDLKPTNIMVDIEGKVKVIDFGIAKFEDDPDQTIPGAFLGTPQFAPPEQFSHDKKTDWGQCDIYALGMTLYFCLTGRLPYAETTAWEIAEAKRIQDPPPPSEFNKDVTKDLDRIILKSLARIPEQRYATATEMKRDLLAIRNQMVVPQTALMDTVEWVMGRRSDEAVYPRDHEKRPAPRGTSSIFKWTLIGALAAVVAFLLIFDPAGWFGPQSANPSVSRGIIAVQADEPVQVYIDDSLVLAATMDINLHWDTGQHHVTLISHAEPIDTLQEDIALTPGETFAVRFERPESLEPDTAGNGETPDDQRTAEPSLVAFSISTDANIDLYWDGQLMGTAVTSATINSEPGRHILELRNSSLPDQVFVDTVQLGELRNLHRSYDSLFVARFGELRVGSLPLGGIVRINGRIMPERTPYTFKLPVGTHSVAVASENIGLARETTLTVQSGQTTEYFVEF